MTTKYTTSLYGRAVYLIYFILLTPFCVAFVGVALFPMPYSEPSIFGKIVLIALGGAGALRTISFTRNILWFSPRILINEIGIKYNGFYLHTLIKWEDMASINLYEFRGFSFLKISLKNKKFKILKNISLDVSGISPKIDCLIKEVDSYLYERSGI